MLIIFGMDWRKHCYYNFNNENNISSVIKWFDRNARLLNWITQSYGKIIKIVVKKLSERFNPFHQQNIE